MMPQPRPSRLVGKKRDLRLDRDGGSFFVECKELRYGRDMYQGQTTLVYERDRWNEAGRPEQ
jgi:hypothetical protein